MKKLYICMYHYTRDLVHGRYPRINGLDIQQFKEQMIFFRDNFNVVTMENVLDAIEGRYTLPSNALLLTFDDGYIDNYTVAFPILEEFGFQGSFFIPGKTFLEHKLLDVNKVHFVLANSDPKTLLDETFERINYYRNVEQSIPSNEELWEAYAKANRFDSKEVVFIKRVLQTALPEKIRGLITSDLFAKHLDITEEQLAYELYLNEDQIRIMKKHGMFIGIHGYDHYWLGNLTETQMKNDINIAIDGLCEFVDNSRWVMNYPYGNYNENVIRYIKKKGAVMGLSTKVAVADLDKDDIYSLPRLDCNDFPPKSNNYKNY